MEHTLYLNIYNINETVSPFAKERNDYSNWSSFLYFNNIFFLINIWIDLNIYNVITYLQIKFIKIREPSTVMPGHN